MISEELYKEALLLKVKDVNKLKDEDLELACILYKKLQEESNSYLDKLKDEAVIRNLEFKNETLGIQGFVTPGNSKTVINAKKLVEKIGLENFLEIAKVSEKDMKDKFGEDAEEVKYLKESSSSIASDKNIFKMVKYSPPKPKK
jgi:hypothetical protein